MVTLVLLTASIAIPRASTHATSSPNQMSSATVHSISLIVVFEFKEIICIMNKILYHVNYDIANGSANKRL